MLRDLQPNGLSRQHVPIEGSRKPGCHFWPQKSRRCQLRCDLLSARQHPSIRFVPFLHPVEARQYLGVYEDHVRRFWKANGVVAQPGHFP